MAMELLKEHAASSRMKMTHTTLIINDTSAVEHRYHNQIQ